MAGDVHLLISIPPKNSELQMVGYIKGKSAMHLARVYCEPRKKKLYRTKFLCVRLLRIDSDGGAVDRDEATASCSCLNDLAALHPGWGVVWPDYFSVTNQMDRQVITFGRNSGNSANFL